MRAIPTTCCQMWKKAMRLLSTILIDNNVWLLTIIVVLPSVLTFLNQYYGEKLWNLPLALGFEVLSLFFSLTLLPTLLNFISQKFLYQKKFNMHKVLKSSLKRFWGLIVIGVLILIVPLILLAGVAILEFYGKISALSIFLIILSGGVWMLCMMPWFMAYILDNLGVIESFKRAKQLLQGSILYLLGCWALMFITTILYIMSIVCMAVLVMAVIPSIIEKMAVLFVPNLVLGIVVTVIYTLLYVVFLVCMYAGLKARHAAMYK